MWLDSGKLCHSVIGGGKAIGICDSGLLPPELIDRITAVGNAAGAGAKLLACDKQYLELSQDIVERTEFLDLANLPDFPKNFSRLMGFNI